LPQSAPRRIIHLNIALLSARRFSKRALQFLTLKPCEFLQCAICPARRIFYWIIITGEEYRLRRSLLRSCLQSLVTSSLSASSVNLEAMLDVSAVESGLVNEGSVTAHCTTDRKGVGTDLSANMNRYDAVLYRRNLPALQDDLHGRPRLKGSRGSSLLQKFIELLPDYTASGSRRRVISTVPMCSKTAFLMIFTGRHVMLCNVM
jgi:hypothetical protein